MGNASTTPGGANQSPTQSVAVLPSSYTSNPSKVTPNTTSGMPADAESNQPRPSSAKLESIPYMNIISNANTKQEHVAVTNNMPANQVTTQLTQTPSSQDGQQQQQRKVSSPLDHQRKPSGRLSLFGSLSSTSSRAIGGGERERSTSYGYIFGRKQSADAPIDDGVIRLILFGGVNSGKTTLVKALKLLYAAEPHLSQKDREKRVNEIRTTVLTSTVAVINKKGTKGWNQDVANAANTLLRASSSFVLIGSKVDANVDDVSSAPTAATVTSHHHHHNRSSRRSIAGESDSDDEDDDNENDDAIAHVIATEDEVHAQISADAAVAAVLSESELEHQAKARAAELIPLPSHDHVPFTHATSVHSISSTLGNQHHDNLHHQQLQHDSSNHVLHNPLNGPTHSNSSSTSFNTTVTSDIGRVTYMPQKHNGATTTAAGIIHQAHVRRHSSGAVVLNETKKKSSSPLGAFARATSGNNSNTNSGLGKPPRTGSKESMDEVHSAASTMSASSLVHSASATSGSNHIATAKESFDGDVEGLPVAEHVMFDAEIVDSLRILYQSEDFQRARMASPSIDAYAGVNELVSHLDTIASSDYQGNDKDYLCAKTQHDENSVHVTELKIQGTPFKIYDASIEVDLVSEWKSDFDNSNAIIYLSALDIYDYPDKVDKTIKGFKKVCKKFKGKPFVLLMNKVDLFREKLKFVPFYMKGMRNDSYKGPRPENAVSQQEFNDSVIAVQNFIVAKYQRIWRKKTGGKGSLVIHFTQSTSPEQIHTVFKATKDGIINSVNATKTTATSI